MSEIQWFIQVAEGKKAGPISFEKLQQLAQKGKFFPTTKIRSTEEGAVWVPAGSVPGLFDGEKKESDEKTLSSIFDAAALSEGSTVVAATQATPISTEASAIADVETTEQPDSGASSVAIDVGDGSSAAIVKVNPFAINRKGGSSVKKGLVEPKKKDDKPVEKKPSGGGFFGLGSKKKESEPSRSEQTEAKETASKESGFPKIVIGKTKSEEPAVDAPEPEIEPTTEASVDVPLDASLSAFETAEEKESETSAAASRQATLEEAARPTVATTGGVPIWLHLVIVLILAAAFVVGGVLHYLAAVKIEEALSSKHDSPKPAATKSVKSEPAKFEKVVEKTVEKAAPKAEKSADPTEDEMEK